MVVGRLASSLPLLQPHIELILKPGSSVLTCTTFTVIHRKRQLRPDENMADSTPSDPPPDYEKSTAETGGPPRPLRKGPLPLDLPILKHLNSKRVILASASPRRKALLQQVRDNSYGG